MVRNTVKTGQSLSLAIMCRKRSAIEMQFHHLEKEILRKIMEIALADCRRKDLISIIEALLSAVL